MGDELNFLGSHASLIELIGMPFWKRNLPYGVNLMCCVVALQRAGPGREPSVEVEPTPKEVLSCAVDTPCAHLEPRARVRSPLLCA